MRRFRADLVWTPQGPLRGGEVLVGGDGRIAEVSGPSQARAEQVSGLLLPGLVNAHAHLELSDLRGRVPGGEGLPSWVQALMAARRVPEAGAVRQAIAEAQAMGTAAIIDVSNSGASLPLLVEAGMRGLVQIELLGIEPERCEAARAAAAAVEEGARMPTRRTCHAVVSCSRDLLAQTLAPGSSAVATMHGDEDPADAALLRDQEGPWAVLLDRLGRDWRGRMGQAPSTVDLLEGLGVLGPGLALVHCVHTGPEALDRIAARGAAVILCPRSNLHIGGRLPDLPGMVRRGIPLAIGTDSLASSPDMDLLGEATALARAFPELAPATWIQALTTGGARLLERLDPGRPLGDGAARGGLVPGAVHGILHLHLPPTDDPARALFAPPATGAWPRSWLSCPLLP